MSKLHLRNRVRPEILRYAANMRARPTRHEREVWHFLRNKNLGVTFYSQSVLRGYIADFYCPKAKLVIEVDGPSHEAVADFGRDLALDSLGIKVLHIKNKQVEQDYAGVFRKIAATVRTRITDQNARWWIDTLVDYFETRLQEINEGS